MSDVTLSTSQAIQEEGVDDAMIWTYCTVLYCTATCTCTCVSMKQGENDDAAGGGDGDVRNAWLIASRVSLLCYALLCYALRRTLCLRTVYAHTRVHPTHIYDVTCYVSSYKLQRPHSAGRLQQLVVGLDIRNAA